MSDQLREALECLINCVECEVNVPRTTTVFQLRLTQAKKALVDDPLAVAQCAGVQPSAEQIEAIAKDYAQRWYGDDFALMDEGDKADLRIEAQHWLKCWFALAAQPPAAPVQTDLAKLILEYARDLRRNSSGGDDYPWEYAKGTADYLEELVRRSIVSLSPSSADNVGQWQLQHSVPSDGFECFYILKNGLQVAEVSGPQNVENTANMQELVNAANAGRPAADDQLADLVARFSAALLEKLRAAEKKYGWTDAWMQDDWQESCQRQFAEHVQKGDPRDVANYCAFMWHHGWATKHLPDEPQEVPELRQWQDSSEFYRKDLKDVFDVASDLYAAFVQVKTPTNGQREALDRWAEISNALVHREGGK